MKFNKFKAKASGFTLVELVIVIAIVAILAVSAIPKFIDIKSDAQQASTDAVAGALNSGNATNYAIRSANSAKGSAVANCTDVENTLQGTLPGAYTITAAAIAVNANVTCTVTGPGSTTSTFTGTGIA